MSDDAALTAADRAAISAAVLRHYREGGEAGCPASASASCSLLTSSAASMAERPALHSEDEAERLHMRGQVHKREGDGFPLVQIVKLAGLEGAQQNKARALAFRQRVEILFGPFVCLAEIAPGALLFDEQHACMRIQCSAVPQPTQPSRTPSWGRLCR